MEHIWGSRYSYMTLQLLHPEFPYRWGKFLFSFCICVTNWAIYVQTITTHILRNLNNMFMIGMWHCRAGSFIYPTRCSSVWNIPLPCRISAVQTRTPACRVLFYIYFHKFVQFTVTNAKANIGQKCSVWRLKETVDIFQYFRRCCLFRHNCISYYLPLYYGA